MQWVVITNSNIEPLSLLLSIAVPQAHQKRPLLCRAETDQTGVPCVKTACQTQLRFNLNIFSGGTAVIS